MGASSAIELFTTIFGWLMYDQIWDLLVGTGIWLGPFITMIGINVMKAHEQAAVDQKLKGKAGMVAIARIEFDFVVMLLVLIIAGMPLVEVRLSNLEYTKISLDCDAASKTVTGANTGTTYDDTFGATLGGKRAEVPLWWSLMHRLAHGVTGASIARLTEMCEANIRTVQQKVAETHIKSPALVRETQDFVRECYEWAKGSVEDERNMSLGSADIDWLGAKPFTQPGGYYAKICPRGGVRTNWTWAESDSYCTEARGPMTTGGLPSCQQWWSDPAKGLKSQLLANIDAGLRLDVAKLYPRASPEEIQEQLLRALLTNEEGRVRRWGIASDYSNMSGNAPLAPLSGFALTVLQQAGIALGTAVEGATHYPKMRMLRKAIPIAVSLMLCGIYMLLPWVLLMGAYRVGPVVTASVAIFALTYIDFLMTAAQWLDNKMLKSLTGTEITALAQITDLEAKFAVDFVTSVLYIGLPALWLIVLGWVGVKGMTAIGSATDNLSAAAGRTGATGAGVGKMLLTKGKGGK